MFKFFEKDKGYPLPKDYASFISKEQYNYIIETSKDYFIENNYEIIDVQEGDILVRWKTDEELHCYLDNLIRKLYQRDKSVWKNIIYEHFQSLKPNDEAYNYFFKDFEYTSKLLRVMIKPEDFFSASERSNYVHLQHFPKTYTLLVIEFENQFRFVTNENIKEWNVSVDELFSIAIANNPNEEIEVKEYLFSDKFTVFSFFSGDYSAGLMLSLKECAEYAIGSYGSLIAIPTKGSAFVHPIETSDVMNLIEEIHPMIIKFYDEDPSNITTNLYWYYNEEITLFPIEQDEKGSFITLPDQLFEMFKEA